MQDLSTAGIFEANAARPTAARTLGEVVIETRNLSKVYRDFWGREKVRALKTLDLEIRRGEIFGLLGPNGSGKTTTMKLLLGLLFPTGGEALVFGKKATEVTKNERIGYLPEESYLYRFLNAEETLDFYGRLFDMPRDVRKKRAAELIQMVGLGGAKRRQLKEYSKGMTRRIGLAQALINDPELILLDEPTSGLDPIGTREMKDLIINLKERGKTVVMCSHLLADVQDVCDRIAILDRGELKELGRVDHLLKVQDVTQFQVKGLSPEGEAEVKAVIQRHQAELMSVDHPTTTLEELFLRIVREGDERPGRRVVRDTASASPPIAASIPITDLLGGESGPADEATNLRQNLRLKFLHDEAKVEAAIEFERATTPDASPVELMRAAVIRWERDNR